MSGAAVAGEAGAETATHTKLRRCISGAKKLKHQH